MRTMQVQENPYRVLCLLFMVRLSVGRQINNLWWRYLQLKRSIFSLLKGRECHMVERYDW